MATASPTPMGSGHFGQISRRPSSRQAYRQAPVRPPLNRNTSNGIAQIRPSAAQHIRQLSLNDSSDDEIPVPMKFSAYTKALLNDEPPAVQASPSATETKNAKKEDGRRDSRAGTPDDVATQARTRVALAMSRENSPAPKRIVRLSSTPGSEALRRVKSLSSAMKRRNELAAKAAESPVDINTPAPAARIVRIPIGSSGRQGLITSSSGSASGKGGLTTRSDGSDNAQGDYSSTVARAQSAIGQGSVSRYGSSTIGRNKNGDEAGLQSSMRVKRVNKVAGQFLSGPARRGRRRQSEEEQDNAQEDADVLMSQRNQRQEPASQQYSQEPQDIPDSYHAPAANDFASGSPINIREALRATRHQSPPNILNEPELSPRVKPVRQSPSKNVHPVYKIPAPPPELPSAHDQENEAPPTFKRNKAAPLMQMDKIEKVPLGPQSADLSVMKAKASPERRPLAVKSQNTPLRPAPPPPKMTVLETATATGGAAASSHASKRRNNVRVNGKNFTRLDVIGRGGSSRVYRVMAENHKIYALKKVSLEDADEVSVRGFKGEIDLLRKLKDVDRVVRLIDYENNEDRKTLSVLMELGELDFNKLLALRFNADDAKFDANFTRHYWKEMLECILSVHEHDIVHSDLKPANFVIIQGRLKLIDFGIANAIETDETVNVHRDTQIGTPNYMSPESLIDSNAPVNGLSRAPNVPRLWKLGKPSDIWSLGCILYQLVYGRPPFAHIPNQMSRCAAIMNFDYAIDYPSKGIGNAPVPGTLIATMRRCLNRHQHERPTAKELLETDLFLNPLDCAQGSLPITEEVLGRIFYQLAAKIKIHDPSDAELLKIWPAAYFSSLKRNLQEGTL